MKLFIITIVLILGAQLHSSHTNPFFYYLGKNKDHKIVVVQGRLSC